MNAGHWNIYNQPRTLPVVYQLRMHCGAISRQPKQCSSRDSLRTILIHLYALKPEQSFQYVNVVKRMETNVLNSTVSIKSWKASSQWLHYGQATWKRSAYAWNYGRRLKHKNNIKVNIRKKFFSIWEVRAWKNKTQIRQRSNQNIFTLTECKELDREFL